jgi:hypothetical protein
MLIFLALFSNDGVQPDNLMVYQSSNAQALRHSIVQGVNNSEVGEQKRVNSSLAKTKEEFIHIMRTSVLQILVH